LKSLQLCGVRASTLALVTVIPTPAEKSWLEIRVNRTTLRGTRHTSSTSEFDSRGMMAGTPQWRGEEALTGLRTVRWRPGSKRALRPS
jgi:hypothetical protein